MTVWKRVPASLLIWLVALALLLAPLGPAPRPASANPAPSSPTLPNDSPHRFVVIVHGIETNGSDADPNFDGMRSAILASTPDVAAFVYFSYGAAVQARAGFQYCTGWGPDGCSSTTPGDLASLTRAPVYAHEATWLPIDEHTEVMRWLLKQIVKRDDMAQIDVIGYSLGGIVTSRWAATHGDEPGVREHIHGLVLVDSPVGGIPMASAVEEGCGLNGACYLYELIGGAWGKRDIAHALKLDGDGSIVTSLRQAPLTFDVTSVESTNDYVVNSDTMLVCEIMVLGVCTVPTWLVPIGKGADFWPSHTAKRGAFTGALAVDANGDKIVLTVNEATQTLLTNHAMLAHPQATAWVGDAVAVRNGPLWRQVHTGAGGYTSPTPGATVPTTVPLRASATSQIPIHHVNMTAFYGGQWHIIRRFEDAQAQGPYSFDWDTTGIADPTVKLGFDIIDTAGGVVYSPQGEITVTLGGPLAGDVNGDCVVNTFDHALLIAAWGSNDQAHGGAADLNHDGIVNNFDYSILIGNWGKRCDGGTDPISPPPTKLGFAQQPSATATAGTAFSIQPSIAVQDTNGVTVTTDNMTVVTLAASGGPGTLTCTGGLSKTAVNGVAAFAGCAINQQGTYTITASSTALTDAQSSSITVVQAGTVTEQEPNDSLMQATLSVPLGGSVTGTFYAPGSGSDHSGDDDWYRLSVMGPGKVALRVQPPDGGGSWGGFQEWQVGVGIEIAKADGTIIAQDIHRGAGNSAEVVLWFDPTELGEYRVRVGATRDGGCFGNPCMIWDTWPYYAPPRVWSENPYTLTATFESTAWAIPSNDTGEPSNDTPAQTTLQLVPGQPASGYFWKPNPTGEYTFGYSGDDDWYRLSVTGPGKVALRVQPPDGGGSWSGFQEWQVGVGVEIARVDGTVIAQDIHRGATTPAEVVLWFDPTEVGEYRVRVGATRDGGCLGNPCMIWDTWPYYAPPRVWSEKPYTLTAAFESTAWAIPSNDTGEPLNNDPVQTALQLTPGQPSSGYFWKPNPTGEYTFGYSGDDDWYRLSVTGPGKVALRVQPPDGGGSWSGFQEWQVGVGVEIARVDGTVIAQDIHRGATIPAEVVLWFDPTEVGEYRVRVGATRDGGCLGNPCMIWDTWPYYAPPRVWSERPYTLTAAFEPYQALTINGVGSGTITSSPSGIDCGADCTESYASGTVVTLTATPASGSVFTGWSGACTNATGTCVVTMDAAKSATATFVLQTFSLSVSKAGIGSGTVTSTPAGIDCGSDCSESYVSGTQVTLAAAPASDSVFAGWSGACTGTGGCAVIMDTAENVTATFALQVFDITVIRAGAGIGSVTSDLVGINCGADCTESYANGTSVTLTATPAAGSVFAGWSGACTNASGTCVVSMDAQKSVTATFALQSFDLAVSKAGTGAGSVTSSPAGIDCGIDCTESYASGTSVTLTATPATGSVFAGWSGACTNASGTCVVTMDSAKSVTAIFTLQTFTLSASKSGAGTGTVTSNPAGVDCGATCSAPFNSGVSVTLMAAPATGSIFTGWSGDCSDTGTCALTMDAAKNVVATFALQTFDLTVAKTGTGLGTVTSSPAGIDCGATCSASFSSSMSVTLTAAPAAGSTFAGWTGACTNSTGPCVVTVDAAKSVTATFALETFNLSVSKAGSGTGTVTSSPAGIDCGSNCTESLASGTSVTLTATPAAGSQFAGWSGACTNTSGTCVIVADAAKSVTATFTLQTFTLSVSKTGAGGGSVTSTPSGIDCGSTCGATFTSGAQVTLAATPSASSVFAGWSGACTNATGSCVVTMDAAKSVTATFTLAPPITFGLTVGKAGAGSGAVTSSPTGVDCGATCTFSFASGTQVTLTATPASGSVFSGWSGACTNATGTCAVTMDAAKTVTATFDVAPPSTFLLTLVKNGTGSGTVTSNPAGISCGADCSESYTASTQVTLTASPAAGSTFTSWAGCDSSNGTSCTVTLSAAKSVTATFTANPVLTVARAGSGSGTVTSTPAGITCGATCSMTLAPGTSVTLTAAPATGTSFAGWTGCDTSSGTTCTVTMTAAKTVTATFAQVNAGVTVTRLPGVQPSGPTLVATVTARSGCGTIGYIQFGETGRPFDNARVTVTTPVGGQIDQRAGFTFTAPAGTTSVSFTIQRLVPSGGATVNPVVLHDGCGDWRTFVGGGPDAFR